MAFKDFGFAIEPTFLSPDELEYELNIRNVFGIDGGRVKTSSLRTLLEKEKGGEAMWPNIAPADPKAEANLCLRALEEVLDNMSGAIGSRSEYEMLRCKSRFRHYLDRLERIPVLDTEHTNKINQRLSEMGTLIQKAKLRAPALQDKEAGSSRQSREDSGSNSNSREVSREISDNGQQILSEGLGSNGSSNRLSFGRGRGAIPKKVVHRDEATCGPLQPSCTRIISEDKVVGPDIFSRRSPDRNEQFDDCQWIPRTVHNSDHGRGHSIHKWNTQFSGDDGHSLIDFLSHVSLRAKAENVSDAALLRAVFFLLKGQALDWYRGMDVPCGTWDELVEGLKREFLPQDYDFLMREKIANRKQLRQETASAFIRQMKILFQKVYPPLSERYKVFIIKRNLCSEYSLQLSTVLIESVDRIVFLCKQMDEARLADRSGRESRQVNEISESLPESRSRSTIDRTVTSRRTNWTQRPNRTRGTFQTNNTRQAYCWNCGRPGHKHYDCTATGRKIFCWFCGKKDVTSQTCPRRHSLGGNFPATEPQKHNHETGNEVAEVRNEEVTLPPTNH